MRIEGRDLENLNKRKTHFRRQRNEMACVKAAEAILQKMQMLDQKIGLARAIAQQGSNLFEGVQVNLPALGKFPRFPPPGAGMNVAIGVTAVALRHLGIVNRHRFPAPC